MTCSGKNKCLEDCPDYFYNSSFKTFAVNKTQMLIHTSNILKIISDIDGHLDNSSLTHLQNIVLIIPEINKKNPLNTRGQWP